jgi:hypothetical protein
MRLEANTDVRLLPAQDSTETEALPEHVDTGSVKDTGPVAFATRVFLVGSEMAIGVVRKQPFFC